MDPLDIEIRYSGGAANADPTDSLGGIMSSEVIPESMQNLFDNVTPAERTAGSVEYRCFYFTNTHPSETLEAAGVYILAQTVSPDTSVSIGLDPAGVGDGVTTGVAVTISDEVSAPSGVSFSEPSSVGAALSVGDIVAGEGIAVWVRRTVTALADPLTNDPFEIAITGSPVEP